MIVLQVFLDPLFQQRNCSADFEVLGFSFQDAAVKVTVDGKVTLAQLPFKQFTEGAEKEINKNLVDN